MRVLLNPNHQEKCLYDVAENHFNMMGLGVKLRYCVATNDIVKAWDKQNNFTFCAIATHHSLYSSIYNADIIKRHPFSSDEEALLELPKLYPDEHILILDMIAENVISLVVVVVPIFSIDTTVHPVLTTEIRKLFLDTVFQDNASTN